MLFTTQPSALRLLASCDAADPVDDFLHALTSTSSGHNQRCLRSPRVVEPQFTYTTGDSEGVLEIDLPGVSRDDLAVEVQGRRLTVTGKRFRSGGGDQEEHRKKVKIAEEVKKVDQVPAQKAQGPVNGAAKSVNDEKQDNADKNDKEHSENGQKTPEKNDAAAKEGSDDAAVSNEKNDDKDSRQASAVFKGAFRLRPKIDTERIAVAQHRDGVLKLCLPYHEKAMPRKITIV